MRGTLLNLPVALRFTNGNRTDYLYGSDGMKRRVTYSTAVANVGVPMGEIRSLSSSQVSATHTVDYCGCIYRFSCFHYRKVIQLAKIESR